MASRDGTVAEHSLAVRQCGGWWRWIGKSNGILAPVSLGAHPRISPHLDAASHLGTAFFLLVPVEIFCLYTAHMFSIVKHLTRHIPTRDAVRRVLAWRQLLPPMHPAIQAARCSITSLPTISRP